MMMVDAGGGSGGGHGGDKIEAYLYRCSLRRISGGVAKTGNCKRPEGPFLLEETLCHYICIHSAYHHLFVPTTRNTEEYLVENPPCVLIFEPGAS